MAYLFFSIDDVTKDTSYDYIEWTNNGETEEHTIVNQTCSWIPDTSFTLTYKKEFISKMNHEDAAYKEQENLYMQFLFNVKMYYNGSSGLNVNPGDNYLPKNYSLSQNCPNPFNPASKISYALPQNSFVELKVFNLLGQEIATLVNQEKPAGTYEVNFDASNLPSGVYIYRIKAGEYVETKKMILLK